MRILLVDDRKIVRDGLLAIAVQLDVAVPTIETYRRQIMDKLNIRSIAELTKYAVREGITSLEP